MLLPGFTSSMAKQGKEDISGNDIVCIWKIKQKNLQFYMVKYFMKKGINGNNNKCEYSF